MCCWVYMCRYAVCHDELWAYYVVHVRIYVHCSPILCANYYCVVNRYTQVI